MVQKNKNSKTFFIDYFLVGLSHGRRGTQNEIGLSDDCGGFISASKVARGRGQRLRDRRERGNERIRVTETRRETDKRDREKEIGRDIAEEKD